jgi:hypothetical protein
MAAVGPTSRRAIFSQGRGYCDRSRTESGTIYDGSPADQGVHVCCGVDLDEQTIAMAEIKYVMDQLSRLSQQTTIDLASRSDVGKWSIEHFLEQAGSHRLERWCLILVLDNEITSRTTAPRNDEFWTTMRNIITQLLSGTT